MYQCILCQKPFNNETSQNRHIRYCGTRRRKRERACLNCSSAKAKCSFGNPCTRCLAKGKLCQYDRPLEQPQSLNLWDASHASVVEVDTSDFLNEENSLNDLLTQTHALEEQLLQYQQLSCITWCAWMKPGFSTSIYFDEPNVISALRMDAKTQSVNLIVQALRCFPIMMLRRETFPWFIHRQGVLCASLVTCMGISQMFSMRTPETRSVVWKSVHLEHSRFISQIEEHDMPEMVAALQACMIYFIMFLIDGDRDDRESLRLLLTLQTLSMHWKKLEWKANTDSWQEWIIEESQNRLTALWFLIGCVVCAKSGLVLDITESYRDLILPSSRYIWEADSLETWRQQKGSGFMQSNLKILGELIDAQRLDFSEELDKWNANSDASGSLLNLAGSIL